MPTQDRWPPRPASKDSVLVAVSPLVRVGLGCGLLAPLLWAAVIVIAGEMRPGFDHLQQYISELGERGSATGPLMRYGGFVATGLLHLAYAAAFYSAVTAIARRRGLALLVAVLIAGNGLGRIGAGLFACEPGCAAPLVLSQRLHSLAASFAFLSIAAAALLAARLFHAEQRLWPLALFSLASAATGLLALALMTAGAPPQAYAGLFERLASGVFSLWILVTAHRLWRLCRWR